MRTIKLILTGLILGVFFLFAYDAMAYDVPKDAVIKVFTKDGKQIGEMSRKEYKVVKLGTSKTVVKQIVKRSVSKNNIIVHGGVGKDGLETSKVNGAFNVRSSDAAVGGLTYCRNKGSWGLCASGFTNKTFTLGLKYNF